MRLVGPTPDHRDEVPDTAVFLDRVSEAPAEVDGVAISPTYPLSRQHFRLDELRYDALYGSLGNPDLVGEIAHARVWFVGQLDDHVTVIRQEGPNVFPWAHLRSIFHVIHIAKINTRI